jgi:flagellar motor switch protein FliG
MNMTEATPGAIPSSVMANSNLPSSIFQMSNAQKLAVLLLCLGPKTASKILKQFESEVDVEQVAYEISALKKVEKRELEAILNEFYLLFQANNYLVTGGVNFARQILLEAYGAEASEKIIQKLAVTLEKSPFDFFNKADPSQLSTSFQHENPQLIALVMAYLKPDRAAAVMSGLPPDIQAEVAMRVASMDRTNPEVLREVERILEAKFSSVVTADFSQAGGVEALAEILNRSDRGTEKAIMESLEVKDVEMAERVRSLMFVFEDIVMLDDRSIQRVLREVETKDLAMSLKGANEAVKDKILRNMSERAAAMLVEDMDYMGAVKSRDVQEKQTFIVGIIRALESSGEIVIQRGTETEDMIE